MSRLPSAALAISVLVLAGCSAAGSIPTSATQGRPSYGVFVGSLDLKGEITVKGTFSDSITSRGETCDQYVRGLERATTLWVVPSPTANDIVGGHIVTLTAGVPSDKPSTGYHGPGTYSQASAIVGDVIVDNTSFVGGDGATATITVADDGSGSLSFTGMQDTSTYVVESGTEHWKCQG